MNVSTRSFLVCTLFSASLFNTGCFVSKCEEKAAVDGGIQTVDKDNCLQFELPKLYRGTPVQDASNWQSGVGVRVINENGDITVDAARGPGTGIEVSSEPFDFEPANEQGRATAEKNLNDLVTNHRPTFRQEGSSVLIHGLTYGRAGWNLRVHLPSDFDGLLEVQQKNGPVKVLGGAMARGTVITSDNGSIEATGLNGTLTVQSGNGEVTVEATPSGTANTITARNGDIDFKLVGVVPSLTLTAQASEKVDISPAENWNITTAAPNSQTIGIGDTSQVRLDLKAEFGSIAIAPK